MCGAALTTTTRMFKGEFILLEGKLLTIAELMPTGLMAAADYEQRRANSIRAELDRMLAGLETGESELDDDGRVWTLRPALTADSWEVRGGYNEVGERLRSCGYNIVNARANADRHDAKAATYRKRAAKLEAGR
jgi:hypothetical protein